MTKMLTPALTPTEWREFQQNGEVVNTWFCPPELDGRTHETPRSAFRTMALANATLPNKDPHKITTGDVAVLNVLCDQIDRNFPSAPKIIELAEALRDKLVALLPLG